MSDSDHAPGAHDEVLPANRVSRAALLGRSSCADFVAHFEDLRLLHNPERLAALPAGRQAELRELAAQIGLVRRLALAHAQGGGLPEDLALRRLVLRVTRGPGSPPPAAPPPAGRILPFARAAAGAP